MDDLRDRYEGCMLGLAIGDALGAATEFLTYDEIRRRFPQDGIQTFHPFRGLRAGSYTDDTEMTIALAKGLLNAKDYATNSIMSSIVHEFVEWKKTTNRSRAPGNTCLRAVAALEYGKHWSESGKNDSKGCGTAMRSAPIGLAYPHALDALTVIASKSSLITHGHPAATAGSVATAFMVASAINRIDINESVWFLSDHIRRISDEFSTHLQRIEQALQSDNSSKAHAILGSGWVAEEAVAGAIYANLVHKDSFKDIVIEAANSGGDTDTKACIAGAIAGARLGRKSIPTNWIEGIENQNLLISIAFNLLELQDVLSKI